MAHRIYYFSGTGNSLWVARKIRESLPDAELIPITRDLPAELAAPVSESSDESVDESANESADESANESVFDFKTFSESKSFSNSDFQKFDSVGLVFPVYMFKPPRIVLEFIQKMPESDYIYAVATCGNGPGKSLTNIKTCLLQTGNKLSAGYIVPLVSNFIVLPKTKSDAAIEKAFKKAEVRAQTIAMNVQEKISHFDKEMPGIIVKPVSWFFFNPAYRRIPALDKQFSVNDKCNHCGICRDVCPVQNIQITASKPVFRHKCEMCFACINWCPQKAVNWTPLTKNKKRYHCKGISKNDVVSNRYYKMKTDGEEI